MFGKFGTIKSCILELQKEKFCFCTISTSLSLPCIGNPITGLIYWNPGFVILVHNLSPFVLANDNKQYGFISLPPFSLEKKILHFFHQKLLELYSWWPFWDEKKRSHISCLSITPGTEKMDCAMKKAKNKSKNILRKFTWDSGHLLPRKTSAPVQYCLAGKNFLVSALPVPWTTSVKCYQSEYLEDHHFLKTYWLNSFSGNITRGDYGLTHSPSEKWMLYIHCKMLWTFQNYPGPQNVVCSWFNGWRMGFL